MRAERKNLFVVGDRVLIEPEKGEGRTRVGLYLPAGAVEKQAVQGGRVVEVGPGIAVPSPTDVGEEPWKLEHQGQRARYVPLEARAGDFALFLRSAAVEIEFEGEKYLIVPHGAILLLVREDEENDEDVEFKPEDFDI